MAKVKTSIYVDKDLWEKFKKHALKRGIEVSSLLEKLIEEEIAEETLGKTLLELAGGEDYEVDFEPVKPRKGLVSELVRLMRDGRDSVLG